MKRLQPWLDNLRYACRHPWVRWGAWINLGLAVAVVVAALVRWPAAQQHRELEAAIDGKRKQMVYAMQAGEMMRQFRHAQVVLPRLERKLQAGARQSDLIDSLGRLARQHDVRVLSQAFDEGKLRGAYSALHVNIALQGRYDTLRNFLDDLSSLPLWIEVQEAGIERARETPDAVRAQLRLTVLRKAPSGRAGS
ncbi:MAG: type 4a pilus biogenesis protein PilO [Gammaproteobacteria bacterium]|nr:type 4a pilus biogenesis protein PilO [Gammaproteobacteria bacterium]